MLNILKSMINRSIPAVRRLAYAPADRLAAVLRTRQDSTADVRHSVRHWQRNALDMPPTFEVADMSLSEARFHDLVDAVQQTIEDVFDDSDLDLDLENSGGVLTVRFENGSQLIFSRQEPLRQLWLAARSGGFHFDYDEEQGGWICDSSDELLSEMLVRICREQAGVELEFELD